MTRDEALAQYDKDKNLHWADLREADLHGADLREADLHEANLHEANLHRANLSGANLHWANLHEANLHRANLHGASLREADLHGADLHWADLREADLHGADLREADLHGADLREADLHEANLHRANLHGANLSGANLKDCKGIVEHSIVPQFGSFHGFKKLSNGAICEIIIGKNAKRVGGLVGRKCRAEYAKVVSGEGFSSYDNTFEYKPGKIVRAKDFDPDPRVECSRGIHFFLTREEAESY